MKHKNSFERGVYEMKRQCSDKGKELLYYIRANTEFKWLSCFDSLIIPMKGLAEKKDSVPNAFL